MKTHEVDIEACDDDDADDNDWIVSLILSSLKHMLHGGEIVMFFIAGYKGNCF
jgi:hypothetical protein